MSSNPDSDLEVLIPPELHQIVVGQLDAAVDHLRDMLAIVRAQGGYLTAVQQSELRGARGWLADMGLRERESEERKTR